MDENPRKWQNRDAGEVNRHAKATHAETACAEAADEGPCGRDVTLQGESPEYHALCVTNGTMEQVHVPGRKLTGSTCDEREQQRDVADIGMWDPKQGPTLRLRKCYSTGTNWHATSYCAVC